jgi:hypothetical protein
VDLIATATFIRTATYAMPVLVSQVHGGSPSGYAITRKSARCALILPMERDLRACQFQGACATGSVTLRWWSRSTRGCVKLWACFTPTSKLPNSAPTSSIGRHGGHA